MMDKAPLKFSTPSGVAAPLGRYSHVVSAPPGCRLLVLAGQVGMQPDGSLPADFSGQFEVALENIIAILGSEHAEPRHIIKLNTWVVDGVEMDYSKVSAARDRLLGSAKPASTLAYVSRLFAPAFLVELEAWAAIPAFEDVERQR